MTGGVQVRGNTERGLCWDVQSQAAMKQLPRHTGLCKPARGAAFIGEHRVFAEGLSRKAMVTAARSVSPWEMTHPRRPAGHGRKG